MKAYDPQVLLEKLQKVGAAQAETTAEKAYTAVKEWITESAQASKTPLDDLAIPFLKQVDDNVLPQLDKIDGQPG